MEWSLPMAKMKKRTSMKVLGLREIRFVSSYPAILLALSNLSRGKAIHRGWYPENSLVCCCFADWVRCRASHMHARIMSLPLLIMGARHNNNKSSVIPQVGSEEGDLYVDLMKIVRAR
ncbi:hypothetical protein KY284_006130 [Solanum tuberosum]|nr:hypothetical protein KY284_006130 [Solanum tuberosum]